MSEISKYENYKKKLQGICDENDLIARFKKNTYPITLTIRPCSGMYAQMSMLENVEEKGYIKPDSYLLFEYKDGAINYRVVGDFTVSEALFAKLKNLFKNMHTFWLQYFFRTIIENDSLKSGRMPVIDEDEADDTDSFPEEAEALEELDIPGQETELTDDEIDTATRIVRMENKASTMLLQRRMNIDNARAEQLMDILEDNGVIGPYNDGEDREVLPYDMPEDIEDGADDE